MRWWVAFSDGDPGGWWRPFLKPGFRHCRAWCQVIPELCVELEPARSVLAVTLHGCLPYALVKAALDAGERVVVIDTTDPDVDPTKLARISRLLTCASVIAYATKVPCRALSPWQLYKGLLRHGGIDLGKDLRGRAQA